MILLGWRGSFQRYRFCVQAGEGRRVRLRPHVREGYSVPLELCRPFLPQCTSLQQSVQSLCDVPCGVWRVACGVWRVRVPPPSVSVEDAADGRCALPCLFSLKHVQFSRARPHTRDAKCDECRGKVVSRIAPPQSAGARADSPGTGYRYALPGFRRGANSLKTYIYITSLLSWGEQNGQPAARLSSVKTARCRGHLQAPCTPHAGLWRMWPALRSGGRQAPGAAPAAPTTAAPPRGARRRSELL